MNSPATATHSAPARLRAAIPALQREVPGGLPVYLDAPGGTQMPQPVLDVLDAYVQAGMANRHGTFVTSIETDQILTRAREQVGALLGTSDHVIVFGQNMTSLSIALATSMARDWPTSGRSRVVVSELDHQANVDPWRAVAEDRGLDVAWLPVVPEEVRLDLDHLPHLVDEQCQVVTVGLSSNAVGTVTDVARICAQARAAGAVSVIDAVHGLPHLPVDMTGWDADVVIFSAYKFFGPHLGVMAIRSELLDRVRFYKVVPAPLTGPGKAETGSQNHEAIAALSADLEFIASLAPTAGPDGTLRTNLTGAVAALAAYEDDLVAVLIAGLRALPGVTVVRAPDPVPVTPTVAFTVAGRRPREIAAACAERGVFLTDGDFYATRLAERTGVSATGGWVRAGVAPYLVRSDIDRALEAIAGAVG
jgi:cysteine desulfurase family protein (TIGR01976 family)